MADEDSKLTLINTPAGVEPRNYWNTSGKNREFFPTEPLPDSIPTFNKHGRVIAEPKNEWWINSKDHHFCFWTYLKDKSQPDGTMEPLLQSEIAKLMGCSITKLHFMLIEAMEHLKSPENMAALMDLNDLTEPEPQEEAQFSGSLDDMEELTSEDDED
jgi:hypothetical protein